MNLTPGYPREWFDKQALLGSQQSTQWQELLSAEIRNRLALESSHQQAMTRLKGEEIHGSQRSTLILSQLQEINQLKSESRVKRQLMRTRHLQEQTDLEQLLKPPNEAM